MFLDVIAVPMIAMVAAVYIILPAALVALAVFLTVRIIRRLKKKNKEDNT